MASAVPASPSAGGEQSGRDSESLGRNGATGALAGRVNLYIIWHIGLPKRQNRGLRLVHSQSALKQTRVFVYFRILRRSAISRKKRPTQSTRGDHNAP